MTNTFKNILLMGATGSVGLQAMEVIRNYPERFRLLGAAIWNKIDLLIKNLETFPADVLPLVIAIADPSQNTSQLKAYYESRGQKVTVLLGMEGLNEMATWEGSDLMIAAIVGARGLGPTLKALESGIDVALANKEALIMAGPLVLETAQKNNARIIPVDSEHSAIRQLLDAHGNENLDKVILTASGGAFRDLKKEELSMVTVAQALNHPTWNMGEKITIDSATLMNKGLEVIEAHYLFELEYERIDVILHKESLIHAMVAYESGLVYAEISPPSMLFPISSALFYPEKFIKAPLKLDFRKIQGLSFEEVDHGKYPALGLCYEAGKKGGSQPIIVNAANEIAVELFLKEKISFVKIPMILEKTMKLLNHQSVDTLGDILAVDTEARIKATEVAESVIL